MMDSSSSSSLLTTSISSTRNNKKIESKFERFERWLHENHSEFSMLELRSYDDNVNNIDGINHRGSNTNQNNDIAEEKKEMYASTSTLSSSNLNSSKATINTQSNHECNDPNNNNNNNDDNIHESEMRGVHAKQDIPPNTICVSIPKKCLITVEMGQATPIGQIILKSDLDLDAPKHIFLMIFLLYDRKVNGEHSFFKPYYDILPKTLHNIPIFWTNDELKYLQGSYLLVQIQDRIDAITEDYYSICEVAPEFVHIASLEEFKWARMCVCSRNFGLQIDGHRTSALVPHADMLNHHRPRETKWTYDDDLGAFTITTLQRISKGSQVYDSYGQKCNHRFLLNYGFAVEDNREIDGFCPNEVPIALQVLPDDPLFDAKQEFWMRGENDGNSIHHSSNFTAAVAAAMESARSQNIDPTVAIHSAMQAALSAATNDLRQGKRQHHGQLQNNGDSTNNNNCSSSGGGGGDAHNSNIEFDSVKRIRVCVSNNENTRVLFSMLRVLACNEEELHIISSSPTLPFGDSGCSGFLNRAFRGITGGSHSESFTSNTTTEKNVAMFRTSRDIRHPLSLRNEKAMMMHLLHVVKSHLSLYPCSLAEDVTDLMDEQSYPRFSNRRHAKIQVRGEKEVLHHFALWAQTAIDVIEIIEREIMIANRELSHNLRPQQTFEDVIHLMDEGDIGANGMHHTIVRYCCDVLGALRKDAMRNTKYGREMSSRETDSSRLRMS